MVKKLRALGVQFPILASVGPQLLVTPVLGTSTPSSGIGVH